MKVLLIGSSPVVLTLASLLSKRVDEVTIIENRRNIGGAWRLGKPFLQVAEYIPIYNNIMLACSEYEATNFSNALKLLDQAGASYEKPIYPVKLPERFSRYPYRKINIEPLISNIKSIKNIFFIRACLKDITMNKDNILVDDLGYFDQIFMPQSIPIKRIIAEDNLVIKHNYIQSKHLHCLLPEESLAHHPKTFYSEPFSSVFDRGSLLPIYHNQEVYGLFRGRIAREYKHFDSSSLISICSSLSRLKILEKKRYIYISSYLSEDFETSQLQQLRSHKCINIIETAQLVSSLLFIEKLIQSY